MPTRLILQEADGQVQVLLHRDGHLLPEPSGPSLPFELPLSPEEREDLRWYLEDYLGAPYAVYEDRGSTIARTIPLWGERLFGAVFGPGKGQKAYIQARENEPCELWVASRSPAFLGLPWELLKDPESPTPLVLDLAGMNRTLPVKQAAADLQPGERLRVLMVIARPYGRRDVGYRMIARPLLERLSPVAGEVRLDVLRPPTFAELKRKLAEAREEGEPYQILHFDGHGLFGRRIGREGETAQGHLVFEAEFGADAVAADQIASLLVAERVPLVVLNACRSGQVDGGASPEAAVATRLLESGAAAAVAMSYSVYVVAAAEFMAAFYEALFAGKTVSQAMTKGRRQIYKTNLRPSPKGPLPLDDWLVPVCYTRQEVFFPRLRPVATRTRGLSLAGMREIHPVQDGGHQDGDLLPEGGRFFGRDAEFQELERSLRLRHVTVLHGLGGTGKTELAKGYARWLQQSGGLEDPSLIFFHSFEPGIASFGLDGVIASAGLRLFGSDFARFNAEQRVQAVLKALRKYRLLLIWDNFETVHSQPDPGQLTPPLNEPQMATVQSFLAEVMKESRGGVIITSRAPEDWLGEAVHRLKVGGLEPQDANEFAEALLAPLPRAREQRKDPAYAELLEVLAGHPLSLRLILPQLEQAADARELVQALRGETSLPSEFDNGEGRLESLGACVHYSFRHLSEEDQDLLPVLTLFEGVADLELLGMLSYEDDVPERFDRISEETWRRLLDQCASLGLLTSIGSGRYRIHPALPAYLVAFWRLRAGAEFSKEWESGRLASVYAHAELADSLFEEIQEGDASTAMLALAIEQRTFGVAVAEALDEGLFGEAQTILQPLNEFWNTRSLWEEAQAWVNRCRELLEDEVGLPPDLDTSGGALWLFMAGSQADRFHRLGALDEAEAEYSRIRKLVENSDGERASKRLAVVYHQAGLIARSRGDLSEAELWTRKSLEVEESRGNSLGMADSYHQLGVLAEERGDHASAEAWYLKGLEIRKGGIRGIFSSHNLGTLSQARGDLAEAEEAYLKSLAPMQAMGDRSGIAQAYHQLGIVFQERGDFDGAESWYRKSLEIRESLKDRPGMALSYAQLGHLAGVRGDAASALDWTVHCVALFPEFPHPATGPAPRNLAAYTGITGLEALEEAWQRCTGKLLPEAVRSWVEKWLAENLPSA